MTLVVVAQDGEDRQSNPEELQCKLRQHEDQIEMLMLGMQDMRDRIRDFLKKKEKSPFKEVNERKYEEGPKEKRQDEKGKSNCLYKQKGQGKEIN